MDATEHQTRRNPSALLPAGATPISRGLEKRRQALAWLLRWHFSTNAIVCQVIGIRDSGYLSKLASHGLVEKAAAPSLASPLYVLTVAGQSEALSDSAELIPYPNDPLRFNHKLLRHSLCVQRTVVKLNGLRKTIPERLLVARGKPGDKMPDALVMTDKTADQWAALEVELTPKYERELDQTMLAHTHALERGDYSFVIYTSQSEALLNRYRQVLEKPIRCWTKDFVAQKWKATKTFVVPAHLQRRFIFLPDSTLLDRL